MHQLLGFIGITDDSAAHPEPEGAVEFSRPPWIALAGLHLALNGKLPTVAKTVASKIV
jgi:hypothetical protein